MSANIRQNRSQVSSANALPPGLSASANADADVSPRLRTVSIIPGMLTGAPERTETSKG